MTSFDVEVEIKRSLRCQLNRINNQAHDAITRINWMHAVDSGVCGCGIEMDEHPLWDNHQATEIPMDKGMAGPLLE